jgi:hypothetical protein
MVRGDNRIEFAAHCPDEDGIGGKWSGDLRIPSRRSEQFCVLVPKSSSVTGMRI